MAKFQLPAPAYTGGTLYARVGRNGQLWSTAGTPAFENPTSGNLANYTIAMTEASGTGQFSGTVPSTIAAGLVEVTAYRRVGGSAAWTDPVVGAADYYWDGTALGLGGGTPADYYATGVVSSSTATTITLASGAPTDVSGDCIVAWQKTDGTGSASSARVTGVAGQVISVASTIPVGDRPDSTFTAFIYKSVNYPYATVAGYATGQAPLQPAVAGRTVGVSAGGAVTTDIYTAIISAPTVNAVPAYMIPTGLDAVSVTAPTGVATTFPQMVVQVWRRFFAKTEKVADTSTTGTIKTYAANGTTVVTTQAYTDDGNGNQTQGAAT
jgi:hypothetical protein